MRFSNVRIYCRKRLTYRVNGREMITGLNVIEEAGGMYTALDRTIENISPENGVNRNPPDRQQPGKGSVHTGPRSRPLSEK